MKSLQYTHDFMQNQYADDGVERSASHERENCTTLIWKVRSRTIYALARMCIICNVGVMLVERDRCMREYVIKFRRVRRSRTRSRKARSRARTISRDVSNCMKSGTRRSASQRRSDDNSEARLCDPAPLYSSIHDFSGHGARENYREESERIVLQNARTERRHK